MLKEALNELAESSSSAVLHQGYQLFKQGTVLNSRLSEGLLHARVRDESRVYDIHADLRALSRKMPSCGCYGSGMCSHFAAALFALQEKAGIDVLPQLQQKLDDYFSGWLDALKEKEEKKRSSYVITYQLSFVQSSVLVNIGLARILKSGGIGKAKALSRLNHAAREACQKDDEDIISQLMFREAHDGYIEHMVIEDDNLLTAILATNRAFVKDHDGFVSLGPVLEGECRWMVTILGEEHLVLYANDRVIQDFYLVQRPWLYDAEAKVLSKIEVPYERKTLEALLGAPGIPVESAASAREKLQTRYAHLPQPVVYQNIEERTAVPEAIVEFDVTTLSPERYFWRYDDLPRDELYTVKLLFKYFDYEVPATMIFPKLWLKEGDKLIKVARDFAFEDDKIARLHEILSLDTPKPREVERAEVDIGHAFHLKDIHNEDDVEILHDGPLLKLREAGFSVRFNSPVFAETVYGDELEWFDNLNLNESGAFFSYSLGIMIDNEPVSVVPLVLKMIRKLGHHELSHIDDEERMTLPLPDGRKLDVSAVRIKPIVSLLLELGLSSKGEKLELSRYQLMLLQEARMALQASKTRWVGHDALLAQKDSLMSYPNIPEVPLPKGLQAQLRHYQQKGLDWLQWLREASFGGVLADDMGLGKTIQTLAHLLIEKESGRMQLPTLIVAPTSLVFNWYQESNRFTPDLNVLIYHGTDRHEDEFTQYDLVITTYGLLQRDKKKFLEASFHYLILDEAQCIKNARTKTTLIAQQIKANYRLCLTGTPLENHLEELWSLFNFLMPGFLGQLQTFRQIFRVPIEKDRNPVVQQRLAKRIAPFMLRRTKQEVLEELPPKTEMIRMVSLQDNQRYLYEAIRMSMEKKVKEAIAEQGLNKSQIVLLDALLKMRQACCDPRLVKLSMAEKAHGESAKLELLLDLLVELIDEGRRILVFSQFTSMLAIIEEQLRGHKIGYVKLTGQSTNRQQIVQTFQEGDVPVFLISLKAGGTGLNLTKADTVIHYDPWWNPAAEDQATDRAHRIGQEQPVFVYKLIAEGTVEEAMLKMQEKKRILYQGVFDAQSVGQAIALDDIDAFFKPLAS